MGSFMEPSGAIFDQWREHRLYLWRIWDRHLPMIMFIGLNPSTADEELNDQTIRNGIGFSRNWGYGGIFMCNLFTLVSKDPDELNKRQPLCIGSDLPMRVIRKRVDKAVACWGGLVRGICKGGDRVERIIWDHSPLYCLGKTKDGDPKHPLYIPYSQELEFYR